MTLLPRDPAELGSYRLTGRLGSGGFGVIYSAEAVDGSQVAIKLLNSELSVDPSLRVDRQSRGLHRPDVESPPTSQKITDFQVCKYDLKTMGDRQIPGPTANQNQQQWPRTAEFGAGTPDQPFSCWCARLIERAVHWVRPDRRVEKSQCGEVHSASGGVDHVPHLSRTAHGVHNVDAELVDYPQGQVDHHLRTGT